MRDKGKIVGIVNVTPDSFYPDSRTAAIDEALLRALQLVEEGADMLDIGGESTRPGAHPVSVHEEIERVIPLLQALTKSLSIPLSVDTMKPEVAELAILHGASMINDVSGFCNERMRNIVAEAAVDCCVVHMQGTPLTMQQNPFYERGVIVEVLDFLDKQAKLLMHEGVEPGRIVVDPGIGFGKTLEENFALVGSVPQLSQLGFRTFFGVSRKSFLRQLLNREVEKLIAGTLAVNSYLLLAGADFIRVHDVAAHVDARDALFSIPDTLYPA
jgi:dihydropteroate synthase